MGERRRNWRQAVAAGAVGLIASVGAMAAGSAIAWVDSRPNWDDTGVTAALLLIGGGLSAGAGLPWWLATLLVGGPVVVLEFRGAGWGIVIAPAFAAAGALVGKAVRYLTRGTHGDTIHPGGNH